MNPDPLPRGASKLLSRMPPMLDKYKFYLAGGSALALQYRHRISQDLDFFTGEPFRVELLEAELKPLGKFVTAQTAEGTLHGTIGGTKISFLRLPYPLLKQPVRHGLVNLAHPFDIGLTKISAISQRGARRDFIDLWFICQREAPLDTLLGAYPKKYGKGGTPIYHIVKSLCYFADAENDPETRQILPAPWKSVKAYFRSEAARLYKKLI